MNQPTVLPSQQPPVSSSNTLPTLNQTSLNIGSQVSQNPTFNVVQNQGVGTVAQEQQNLIDSILPILSNENGGANNRNVLLMPYDGNKDISRGEKK